MITEQTQLEAPLTLTDKQVFTEIWISPRKVFKFINDNHYDKYANVLLFFAGVSRAFDRASLKDMGDTMSLGTIIGVSIFVGGLLGWISFYFYAALVSWTGDWLKGKGDTRSILRVFAYAMLPAIFALVFLIPQISIYGIGMFQSDGDVTSAGLLANIFVYGSMICELVLGIWAMVLVVVGVSEVQKLSIGKAILNLLLPVLLFVPLIMLIALII
ncbi:Yip1 family protein [Owenweeksia hongkongensis]|uniref:Yip1 family protein n=1 Tax=Owenweeksia hongkongensis TaxID=253245 RepID=UPI003A95CDA3